MDFKDYREGVRKELRGAGIDSDDISSLLECRDLINGQLEYLRDLSSNYYEKSKEEESVYKASKAAVIGEATNPTRGKVEADAQDEQLRKEFTLYEGKYKRIRAFVDTLSDKDDILKQKISYLKSEMNLNNFIKG